MDKLRAAVIGCGNISRSHFSAIENCENVELGAVCDINAERADKCAEKYGVKAYYSIEELLADGAADSVHICTPHYLHAVQSIEALEAGCHVFCEKPMAIRYSDALKVEKTARRCGKSFGVCFQNRYNASSVEIKKLLDSGSPGKILGIKSVVAWDRDEEYYLADSWRGKIATEGGGVMINQAIHTLDLTQWFASSRAADVKASISTKRLYDFVETEDTADALITFENGARAVFYATLCYAGNSPVEIEINCENGRIVLSDKLTVYENGKSERAFDISRPSGKKAYWGSGHSLIINDFYDCIATGRKFPVGASEAKIATELVERIYKSAGRSDFERD